MNTSPPAKTGIGSKARYAALAGIASMGLASPLSAATLLFDFGRGDTGTSDLRTLGHWNNVATLQGTVGGGTGGTGLRLEDAITDAGDATDVDLRFNDDFSAMNFGGVVTTSGVYPASAQRDSFFVSASDGAQIQLEGLVANESYDLTFFGSRAAGGDRQFTVTIAGHTPATLGNANNAADTVSITGVSPDSQGRIVMDVTTQGDFGYFGVMEVRGAFAVPEPASAMLVGLGGLGLLRRRA